MSCSLHGGAPCMTCHEDHDLGDVVRRCHEELLQRQAAGAGAYGLPYEERRVLHSVRGVTVEVTVRLKPSDDHA